jgi:hypothetical protein
MERRGGGVNERVRTSSSSSRESLERRAERRVVDRRLNAPNKVVPQKKQDQRISLRAPGNGKITFAGILKLKSSVG